MVLLTFAALDTRRCSRLQHQASLTKRVSARQVAGIDHQAQAEDTGEGLPDLETMSAKGQFFFFAVGHAAPSAAAGATASAKGLLDIIHQAIDGETARETFGSTVG